jgi:hypothetical protein
MPSHLLEGSALPFAFQASPAIGKIQKLGDDLGTPRIYETPDCKRTNLHSSSRKICSSKDFNNNTPAARLDKNTSLLYTGQSVVEEEKVLAAELCDSIDYTRFSQQFHDDDDLTDNNGEFFLALPDAKPVSRTGSPEDESQSLSRDSSVLDLALHGNKSLLTSD